MDDDITVLILSIFWLRTMQSITQAQDFHKAKFSDDEFDKIEIDNESF